MNLKHLQAALVLLKAAGTSAQGTWLAEEWTLLSEWAHWLGGEYAAGSGWACGRPPKGPEGRDAAHISEGPPASLLSRISDSKNSTKEKTRKRCNVTSATYHCKLSTSLNTEMPEGKVRRRGFQEASSSPTRAMFTW